MNVLQDRRLAIGEIDIVKLNPVPKRRGLLRNVAVALGNSKNPEAIGPLRTALQDPEPLIRGHAAWALSQFAESEAHGALVRHLNREDDEQVKAEVQMALARASY